MEIVDLDWLDVQRTSVWGLGVRIGWWPCIYAPFFQVHAGPLRLTAWYAFKRSYTNEDRI